ncbi:hypothetical protein [Roseococcus microcysteis]|uniref:hypothetical protein n=1 Tax=Roseococcus microcysteis TaxID=2771361 RepID=UPI001CC6A753|nr:hypothetical protein [Roseococcus microcysteis]
MKWPRILRRREKGGIANFSMRGVKREEELRRTVFTRRALLLGGVQLGAFGFLGWRLHTLQVDQGERFATLAEENRRSARLLSPPAAASSTAMARWWPATG